MQLQRRLSSYTQTGLTQSLPNHFISIFFFNHTTTTEIYTLSLHDALPILPVTTVNEPRRIVTLTPWIPRCEPSDRKSTRLNSSHGSISYAVFCLKKKK